MGPRGGGDFAAGFAFEEEGGLGGPGGGGWDFAGAARRERPGDARRGPKGAAAVGGVDARIRARLEARANGGGSGEAERSEGEEDDDGSGGGLLPGEEPVTSSDSEGPAGGGVLQESSSGDEGGSESEAGSSSGEEEGEDEGAPGPAPPRPGAVEREELADSSSESEEDEAEDDGGARGRRGPRPNGKAGAAGGFFAQTPDGTRFAARAFTELHLSRPLVKSCTALGFSKPTPIQAACIPLGLTGRDICGSASTGSGKTAAFTLPLLERMLHRPRRVNATYVLVLTPTRELAAQVHSMMQKLAQFTDIRMALVVGGLSVSSQAAVLRTSPEVVIATPGRMIDHLHNTQSVGLEDLQALVLDEADRLLEMGFKDEINEIVRMCPKQRQTMLFSATMSTEVDELASLSLKNPVRLAADLLDGGSGPSTLQHEVVRIKGPLVGCKEPLLMALCTRSFKDKTIVFSRTKQQAHRLKIILGLGGLAAAEIHGDLTQAQRLESLERFKRGEVSYLVATDVAARGLDIQGVESVINFDCPRQLNTYVHRVGRTARAGRKGCALTFVEEANRKVLKQLVRKLGGKVKSRTVPASAVDQWREKVTDMGKDIWGIIREEKEEAYLRKVEREADRAQNLVRYADEIKGRPAKTWFQTGKEKRQLEKKLRADYLEKESAALEGDGAGQGKGKKAQKNADRKRAREEEARQAKSRKRQQDPDVPDVFIKASKSRERKLREQGAKPGTAFEVAQRQVGDAKPKAKKKRKAAPEDDLFEGDGLAGRAKRPQDAAPKDRFRKAAARPERVSAEERRMLNYRKRGFKPNAKFKSKSKYKRR